MGDVYASCRSLSKKWAVGLAILGVLGVLSPASAITESSAGEGRVESVEVQTVGTETQVSIRYQGEMLEPRSFLLPGPSRLVMDLSGLTETDTPAEFVVEEGAIDRVRTAAYPEKVRVVLAADDGDFPPYSIEQTPGALMVRIGGAPELQTPAAADVSPESAAALAPVSTPEAPVVAEPVWEPTVEISSVAVGPDAIVIEGAGELDADLFELGDGTIALSFSETGLEVGLEGRREGNGDIRAVDVFRSLSSDGRDVRVVVELAENAEVELVEAAGSVTLQVQAAPVATTPVAAAAVEPARAVPAPVGPALAASPVAEMTEPAALVDEELGASDEASEQVIIAGGRRYTLTDDEAALGGAAEEDFETDFFKAPSRYVGEKISIDVQDADVQNVLRLLAEISGKNMIIAQDVNGQVTIKLKDIPWDQVLDLILKTNQLGKEEDGNIIRIATLDTLEREQEAVIAQREREKRLDRVILKIVPVNFADADEMQDQLQSIASDRPDASIDVDARTNSLIIKDTEVVVDVMVDLVRSLDTPTPQVLIEARIVEANINFSRQFGIQWGAGYVMSPETGNPVGLQFPNAITLGGFPTGEGEGGGGGSSSLAGLSSGPSGNPLIVNLPAAVSSDSGGAFAISLQSLDDTFGLDLLISALEDGGHGRLVSSPRIITLDNEEATIEQGFDIPFRTVSEEGAEVSFQSASLELNVTPHITPDESIVMDVEVSNDSPDFSQTVEGNPLVARKSAETQVLIRNGQTAVIGGVFQIDTDINESGVPWLKDLPVLGLFFRRNTEIESKNELIVFITPTIIKRTEG